MLIRSVCFQNLNSLAGRWAIDFADPIVAAEGVIAITGPTGAGKSTILDAVSLALYGRTPRLGSINKSGNEIMSRGTGECFAEVVFSTNEGTFCCHWSQRRAKGSPAGKLQEQKHEVSDVLSGEILASKIQDVADRVESLTGMDFARFTRTIFLAQGNFAAFLQARPDERSPILEQITGTGIYSLISQQVHERCVEERNRVAEFSARLGALCPLEQDEKLLLQQSLEMNESKTKILAGELTVRENEIAWLRGIDLLKEELRQVELQKGDWQARMELFAPQRERLQRAMRALELAGTHVALVSLRKEQAGETTRQQACRDELSRAGEEAERSAVALQAAQAQLKTRSDEYQHLLPLLRQVRSLDTQLRAQQPVLQRAEKALSEKSRVRDRLVEKLRNDSSALGESRKKMMELEEALIKSQADAMLVEHYEALRTRVDFIRKAESIAVQKKLSRESLEKQFAHNSTMFSGQEEVLAVAAQTASKTQAELERILEELSALLAGKSLEDWRTEHAGLVRQKERLQTVSGLLKRLHDAGKLAQERTENQQQCIAELARVNLLLPEREDMLVELEAMQGALEKQLLLLQKIGSYEEERAMLAEGAPCPLCGALEHPFCGAGRADSEKGTARELDALRQKLKSVSGSVSELKLRQLALDKDIERLSASLQEGEGNMLQLQQELSGLCEEACIDSGASRLPVEVEKQFVLLNAEEEAHARMVQNILAMQSVREELEPAQKQAAAHLLEVEKKMVEMRFENKALLDSLQAAHHEYEEQARNLSSLMQDLERQLAPLALEEKEYASLDSLLALLATWREARLRRESEKRALQQKIAGLNILLTQQEGQLHGLEEEVATQRVKYDAQIADHKQLVDERSALFGQKDPDREETLCTGFVEQARKQAEAAVAGRHDALKLLASLETRLGDLSASIESRRQAILVAESDFGQHLRGRGFADEKDYLDACLDEEHREKLRGKAQALADEEAALSSQQKRKQHSLNQEMEKKVTLKTLDEILLAREETQEALTQAQREIGVVSGRLQENWDTEQKYQSQLQLLEKQKEVCSRWEALHDLIGAADGKKFRNFAQGLTFELLISHANKQLRSMSDRYLLLHSPDKALELSVIDNYQAGEVRSTKNLSGGEAFIVSLALALGLSQMASRNVQVGSLFLDEGFGSLDEDSLDIALDTLGSLKQEGKLIVVISHVQALKERIGTRIQVTPLSGGRSTISGPGCRSISQA